MATEDTPLAYAKTLTSELEVLEGPCADWSITTAAQVMRAVRQRFPDCNARHVMGDALAEMGVPSDRLKFYRRQPARVRFRG